MQCTQTLWLHALSARKKLALYGGKGKKIKNSCPEVLCKKGGS